MKNYTRIIRSYSDTSFRHTIGNIDVFSDKQFHPFYEIYLLLDGKAEFINEHLRTDLRPYNLVVIPPGEYHRFVVDEKCIPVYERCVLNIYPELLGETVINEALSDKRVLELEPDSRIVKNFIYLNEAAAKSSGRDFEYILPAVATDIVFLIKQYKNVPQPSGKGFTHPLSDEIMDYINRYYKTGISLNDIAKHFYFSVSSVSHIFKDDFGISIKAYITEKRMNEIHTQLKNGKKPFELSEEFGFANYSTFFRSYCKRFGIPPSHTAKKKSVT